MESMISTDGAELQFPTAFEVAAMYPEATTQVIFTGFGSLPLN